MTKNQTTLINIRTGARYDVYIGRGSPFGNPYTHKDLKTTKAQFQVASRLEAIVAYEEWVLAQPKLIEQILSLKGLVLGCYCKPFPCHGDVLLRLINAA